MRFEVQVLHLASHQTPWGRDWGHFLLLVTAESPGSPSGFLCHHAIGKVGVVLVRAEWWKSVFTNADGLQFFHGVLAEVGQLSKIFYFSMPPLFFSPSRGSRFYLGFYLFFLSVLLVFLDCFFNPLSKVLCLFYI